MSTHIRISILCVFIAVFSAAFGAIFLWTLHGVTLLRQSCPSIVWALPIGGGILGWVAIRWAGKTHPSANLIVERMRGGETLPASTTIYALVTTLIAHLFGASVGREGTAVQIGGGVAELIARVSSTPREWGPTLVAVGAAAGFSSVFGAPIAGALFACEVQRRWGANWKPLIWALPTSLLADYLTRTTRAPHTRFPRVEWYDLTVELIVGLAILGLALSALGCAFIALLRLLKPQFEALVPDLRFRLALGGAATLVLWLVCGSSDYLGLGTPTIEQSLSAPVTDVWAFAWKFVFTLAAIGSGFPGGEVTPLFFMGATLGNALSPLLGLPLDLAAGVALFAMFGGPAGTPFAMAIMAAECLGVAAFPYAMFVSLIVFVTLRRVTLYPAQFTSATKGRESVSENEVDRT